MADDVQGTAGGPVNATYPLWTGNRVKFYALGSDDPTGSTGAFAELVQAIKNAKEFIFIADWSFQALTRVEPRTGSPKVTDTIGAVLNQVATNNPSMLVAIHVWDHTLVGAPDDNNDSGDKQLDDIAVATSGNPKQKRPGNVIWRKSSRGHKLDTLSNHIGNSIHQKFVVLDADEGLGRRVVKVFMGGLDLTKGRFDFAAHPVLTPSGTLPPSGEPFAPSISIPAPSKVFGSLRGATWAQDDWYNAEFGDSTATPRQPWQDFYLQMFGPSAWDIVREFVGRWNTLGTSDIIATPSGDIDDLTRARVRDKFLSLFDKSKFVQQFEVHGAPSKTNYPLSGGPFLARIVRSIEQGDWGPCIQSGKATVIETPTASGAKQTEFTWKLENGPEKSIQNSYVNAIGVADRFIYIENQYFIGSGSAWTSGVDKQNKPNPAPQSTVRNDVPGAIVRRIIDRITHDLEFHAYIVIPMFPEGDPSGTILPRQRFFEFQTMKFMALAVQKAAAPKGKDWRDFLSFYCLANWEQVNPKLTGKRAQRVKANHRYQIYVHSKLMIIDDEVLIVGSANLNERSLAGDRDTEIAVSLTSDSSGSQAKAVIKDLRSRTWLQHLNNKLPGSFDDPQKAQCVGDMRTFGEGNWKDMAQGKPSNGHLLRFPFVVDTPTNTMSVNSISPGTLAGQDLFIFDAPATFAGPSSNGTTQVSPWGWESGTTLVSGVAAAAADFLSE